MYDLTSPSKPKLPQGQNDANYYQCLRVMGHDTTRMIAETISVSQGIVRAHTKFIQDGGLTTIGHFVIQKSDQFELYDAGSTFEANVLDGGPVAFKKTHTTMQNLIKICMRSSQLMLGSRLN